MTTPKKKCELDVVLYHLKAGLTKGQIRKKLNLKSSTLANRLRRLEDLGCIERRGKYIIKVLRSSHKNPRVTRNQVHKTLNKRGHAHNFKIYFPKETNLKGKPKVKTEEKLKQLEKLSFGSLKFIKKKYTIWINRESLTIYSNNSYYSKDALYSKFQALKDVDNLVQELKDRFEFKGKYGIEIFREHYGLIFNKFAKWLLSKNKKLYVQDLRGKTILWVDDSREDDVGLKEFESHDPQTINNADSFFESQDKTGWKNDAHVVGNNKKEIANLKGVFPAMDEYNKNLKLHTEVQREQLTTQKQTQELLTKLIDNANK